VEEVVNHRVEVAAVLPLAVAAVPLLVEGERIPIIE